MTIFEPYESVLNETKAEINIKRSAFTAYLAPCTSKQEAVSFIEKIRALHWDAVHHCFAWRLGPQGMEYRMSDDGEPSGTAGKPLLFTLQQSGLSDVVLVVARYFGGVKLGVGPLARAYSEVGQLAIADSQRWTVRQLTKLTVFCTYDDVSTITDLLNEVESRFTVSYSDAVTFEVEVAIASEQKLIDELISRTKARAGYSKIATE